MQIRGPRSRHRSSLSSTETENMESSQPSTHNVMDFLIDVCPEDVLPKILAFAGPQKTATLSKVNRVWRDVIAEEWTWRVLCEDLYKVCSCSFSSSFHSRLTPRVAGLQNTPVLPIQNVVILHSSSLN
jgi:hypothetical protein